jgi:hypothetical protein
MKTETTNAAPRGFTSYHNEAQKAYKEARARAVRHASSINCNLRNREVELIACSKHHGRIGEADFFDNLSQVKKSDILRSLAFHDQDSDGPVDSICISGAFDIAAKDDPGFDEYEPLFDFEWDVYIPAEVIRSW